MCVCVPLLAKKIPKYKNPSFWNDITEQKKRKKWRKTQRDTSTSHPPSHLNKWRCHCSTQRISMMVIFLEERVAQQCAHEHPYTALCIGGAVVVYTCFYFILATLGIFLLFTEMHNLWTMLKDKLTRCLFQNRHKEKRKKRHFSTSKIS